MISAAAIIGAVWGSFTGVLVARVPVGGDVVRGRSRCDSCGAALGIHDLVPVLSWAWLRGRCRRCSVAVSARWTTIELACAGLFALVATVVQDLWQIVLFAPFTGILVALTLIDLEHRRLPNAIVYPSAVVSAIYVLGASLFGAPLSPVDAATGALAFGGVLLLVAIASRGGMGMGDVKFAALIGLVVGAVDLPSVGVAAGASILLGGVAGIVALLRGADRGAAIPFGPMLAAGAMVAILAGPAIADAYLGLWR